MQKALDVFALFVCFALSLYVFAFAITGLCLVASTENCRDNVAGEIVYRSVSPFFTARGDEFYQQTRESLEETQI